MEDSMTADMNQGRVGYEERIMMVGARQTQLVRWWRTARLHGTVAWGRERDREGGRERGGEEVGSYGGGMAIGPLYWLDVIVVARQAVMSSAGLFMWLLMVLVFPVSPLGRCWCPVCLSLSMSLPFSVSLNIATVKLALYLIHINTLLCIFLPVSVCLTFSQILSTQEKLTLVHIRCQSTWFSRCC